MKSFLIILMLWMSSQAVLSQSFYKPNLNVNSNWSFEASHLTTRSIRGWKTGFSVGIMRNNRWSISYFDVSGKVNNEFSNTTKSTYRGGEFGYVVNPKNRLQMGINIRIGLHNQQFISLLPGVTANYWVNDWLGVRGAVARSDGYPHFSIGLGVRLYAK